MSRRRGSGCNSMLLARSSESEAQTTRPRRAVHPHRPTHSPETLGEAARPLPAAGTPWLVAAPLPPVFTSRCPLPPLGAFLPLSDGTPVIGLGPTLTQDDLLSRALTPLRPQSPLVQGGHVRTLSVGLPSGRLSTHRSTV